jgi:hypothetical protein
VSKNFLLRLSPELGEQVDTYRYGNRIPSSAKALRELIRSGLDPAAADRARTPEPQLQTKSGPPTKQARSGGIPPTLDRVTSAGLP